MHPHIERGETLVVEQLYSDWVIQRYILREHGIVVAGPAPDTLIDQVGPQDLRDAVAGIATSWLEPTFMISAAGRSSLRHAGYQAYMVLTSCRMLYTFEFGAVVSKPVAARWLQQASDPSRAELIARALAWRKNRKARVSDTGVDATLALIELTVARSRQFGLPNRAVCPLDE